MAVTVTTAAPTTSTPPIFAGSFGPTTTAKSVVVSTVGSNKRIRVTRLALSGTYETGGFTLTPSEYGLAEVHGIAVVCGDSFGAAVPRLVEAGGTPTVALYGADDVEVAADASVADHVYTVLLFGI